MKSFSLSFLVASSLQSLGHGFVVPEIALFQRSHSSALLRRNLYDNVEAAIQDAQRMCSEDPNSPGCAVAWDIVEELEAADSHRQQQAQLGAGPPAGAMDYAALMGSFDILSKKLDIKLDQLIATCDQFEAWGADPSVAELSQLAAQMKQGMAYVNERLRE